MKITDIISGVAVVLLIVVAAIVAYVPDNDNRISSLPEALLWSVGALCCVVAGFIQGGQAWKSIWNGKGFPDPWSWTGPFVAVMSIIAFVYIWIHYFRSP